MAKTHVSVSLDEQLDESAADGDDDRSDEEVRQLEQDIAESDAQIARGDVVPADAVMASLRRILYGEGIVS